MPTELDVRGDQRFPATHNTVFDTAVHSALISDLSVLCHMARFRYVRHETIHDQGGLLPWSARKNTHWWLQCLNFLV